MKLPVLLLISTLMGLLVALPPTPSCLATPLPLVLPVSLGEVQRFDLENLFMGYNLSFTSPTQDFVTVMDKYHISQRNWTYSMNFTSAKILGNNRFLAIHSDGANSLLYVGMNDENDGVNITDVILVESINNIRCFDIEEVYDRNSSFAIVDCAEFRNGRLSSNQFYYVDLQTMKVEETTHYNDIFVHYNMLQKRTIHAFHDPRNRLDYIFRVAYRSGVDQANQDRTYIEIFETTRGLKPYLLDVIDHTVLGGSSLSIADFTVYDGFLYVLAYGKGLYELVLTPNQRVEIRSFFEIRMDVNRFAINRLGFNDDLNVVFSNGNNLYQYDWIIGKPPVLTNKYGLMPNSEVENLFIDEQFIVLSARAYYHDEFIDAQYRHIWVFTPRTTSWTNAFATWQLPYEGNFPMHYHQHLSVLTVFGNYLSLNIKLYLPFMQINPIMTSLLNKQVEVVITGTSRERSDNSSKVCTQILNVVVINSTNQTIFGTGLLGREKYVVDSPDSREIQLGWTYFGPNLKYDVNIKSQTPTPLEPNVTVLKTVRYIVKWENAPPAKDVVFVDMFTEKDITNSIYGLVQDVTNMTYYIVCTTHFVKQECNCRTMTQRNLERGVITNISQIIDPNERRIALTFEMQPDVVYVYTLSPMMIRFYGSVTYLGTLENEINSVSINSGLLMVSFKIGKRVDIYKLEDVQSTDGEFKDVRPIFRINSQVMRFLGVQYFAPVDAETSPYHLETLFLKTKTGLMALSINEMGFPELLFQIPVLRDYSYEIARDSILIITELDIQLYRLAVPIRRNSNPILTQSVTHSYKLGQYGELVSDQLFYVSFEDKIQILHPDRPSTTFFFDEVAAHSIVKKLDAVRQGDRQFLIALDSVGLSCWEFYFDPKLLIDWLDGQPNFNVELTANNTQSVSNVSRLNFTVFNNSESSITLGPGFSQDKASKLVQFPPPDNSDTKVIPFSDGDWFNGSVLHYQIECSDCNNKIRLHNHVQEVREIVAARAILDLESTYNGVFAQQYDSVLKTYLNDSIEYIVQLPTNMMGEPCTKIAVPFHQTFVVSLCETGTSLNMYLTSYVTEKPFTIGPSESDVRQVNNVKMVDMLMMIVDNEDNPFQRQGGVYLYHLDLNPEQPEQFALLDLIEADDLQIAGFSGPAFITYADFHRIDLRVPVYRLFMTEGRTGGIFIFTFELSPDKQQVVYLSKNYINIHKFFMPEDLIPDPLRILTISIVDHENDNNRTNYQLLLTVANWHHIEVSITLSARGDTLFNLQLVRLFERYPWTLKSYVKFKPGRNGFFAVPYYNKTAEMQFVIVYDLSTSRRDNSYSLELPSGTIPVVRILGAHRVRDIYEVNFDFNETNVIGYDNLLFVDLDAYNMTELKVDRNLTFFVEGTPANQTIKMRALNSFHEIDFNLDFGFGPVPSNDETVEIIWIIILVVGFAMIVGLILVCVYQIKKEKRAELSESKESLITQDDTFKHTHINRSSVDPNEQTPEFRLSQES